MGKTSRRAAAGMLVTLTACSPPPPSPPPLPSTGGGVSTVVLVSIDTWRRDATGFLGGREPSPTRFLDELAADAWVATKAVAPVPLTGPSHWSLLTGRWPWRDGYRVNQDLPRRDAATPVASVLQKAGWRTAAFVSSAALDRRFGFDAGFDYYDDEVARGSGAVDDMQATERRGDATVGAALAWVRRLGGDERLFLWVHLFDPHFPYAAPGAAGPSSDWDAYLAEVAFADAQLRVLRDGLAAAGRPAADSLWAVVADHGEALGEHGEPSHGQLLHGATTSIPLFFSGPGFPARESARLASTVDVVPTLLGRLGLRPPEGDGIDLLTAPEEERFIPLETLSALRNFGLSPAYGLRASTWLWERSPEDHLWDLAADPAETSDVAAVNPDKVRELGSVRRRFGLPAAEPAGVADAETRDKLEALGYVGGGMSEGEGDVREFMEGGDDLYVELLDLERKGDLEAAEELALRFLERYPRAASVWYEAGFVAVGRQELAAAEARFRRAVELDPTHSQAWLNLGNVFFATGRDEEAATAYRRVLDLAPEDLFALFNLGALAERGQRFKEAATYWRKFLELDPTHPQAPVISRKLAAWQREGRT